MHYWHIVRPLNLELFCDSTLTKSRADGRQCRQGAGDTHPFAGRAQAHTALPVQPVGARLQGCRSSCRGEHAFTCPTLLFIELADQFQQLKGASIEMCDKFGDAIGHLFKLDFAFVGRVVTGVDLVAEDPMGVLTVPPRWNQCAQFFRIVYPTPRTVLMNPGVIFFRKL